MTCSRPELRPLGGGDAAAPGNRLPSLRRESFRFRGSGLGPVAVLLLALAGPAVGASLVPDVDAALMPVPEFAPVRNGRGRHAWPDGSVYEGEFRAGLPHGRGHYRRTDGLEYRGHFRDGAFDGEGQMTWPGGRTYTGAFVDGRITGEGRFEYADGSRYLGPLENGRPHGLGTWRSPAGDRYTGEFVHGVRDGWGEYRSADGSRYVGGYRDGQRAGQGTLIAADGTLSRRRFVDGVRDGVAVRISADGSSLTLEHWDSGQRSWRRAIRARSRCRLNHADRRWMVLESGCVDGLAHGRGHAVSTDGTLWIDGARFVLGRLVQGQAIALGQPPEQSP